MMYTPSNKILYRRKKYCGISKKIHQYGNVYFSIETDIRNLKSIGFKFINNV